jgi:hypothetical protein
MLEVEEPDLLDEEAVAVDDDRPTLRSATPSGAASADNPSD